MRVVRRYERGSMLVTTNQAMTQWGQVFGDEMMAAAILARLLHHSHTLLIQGETYRLKQKKLTRGRRGQKYCRERVRSTVA